MKTKNICGLLLLSAILLCACGNDDTATSETASDTQAVETETESLFESDDLPEDLDFSGQSVTWYVGDYNNAYWDDFYAENTNGERINDAIYRSRNSLEERLNVTLEYYRKEVIYANRHDISSDISTSVMAGDNAYDVYSGYDLSVMTVQGEFFHNLNDGKYLNFDKPWWNKSMLGMLPGDKVYTALGDGSLSLIKHTFCLYFNQDKLASFGIEENPYDLVDSGKWTLDKMYELINNTYVDLNGNGVSDYGDNYGLTMGDVNKYIGWHFSLGGEMVQLTDDGYVLSAGSEHMVNVVGKLVTFLRENLNVKIPIIDAKNSEDHAPSTGGNYVDKTFIEGNALFTACLVGDAVALLEDINFEYGMVPYPKYDEAQSNYISAVQRFASFSVPITADLDLSSAVIEAWSSEAYRTIQPEYFETVLKSRYSADNQMADMFDLIRATIRFDISDLFCDSLNELSCEPALLIRDDKGGQWASHYASKEKKWNKALEEIWDALS